MDRSDLRALGLLAVIIGDVVGFTAAGFALGYFVSKRLGLPSWIAVGTAALGLGLAFLKIKRLAERFSKPD